MILTVTINPLLEKVLYFKSLNEFSANRSYKEELKAGGKGINVSRQLNYLGVENLAFTFLGSNNGKDLRSTLTKEGINFTAIASKSETRWGTVIHNENDNSIKSYFSPNQELTEKEVTDFIAKLEKVIPNLIFFQVKNHKKRSYQKNHLRKWQKSQRMHQEWEIHRYYF